MSGVGQSDIVVWPFQPEGWALIVAVHEGVDEAVPVFC
jgi:hypothetical protein